MTTSTIIIVLFLVAAGGWDLFVLYRWGLNSGLTLSWLTYNQAKNWPILAFLVGYSCHALTFGSEIPCLLMLVAGHIFGTMRGA